MRVNPVLTALGAYPIAAVHEKVAQLRDQGRRVIDFSIGDPREPTPSFVRQALIDAVPVSSQYPLTAGLPELRHAVADYVLRRFGVAVDAETQVLATSGSKEAIFSAPLAFVDRGAGDLVAYGTPGYPIYQRGARFAGAGVHEVVLTGDFVLRPAAIPDEVWERAAVVWTCTPHNPSGAVTDNANLAALLRSARAHDTWLFSDECYADVYEPVAHPDGPGSLLQETGGDATGVLAFFSCSKRSGMTGYRSGAVVGDAEAIGALKKLRTATGTASPDFVQAAAVAAWSDDAHAAERREVFAAKRAVLRKAFESAGHRVVASTAGLYLWVEVGDDLGVSERLLDAGVVVSPGRAFGAGGEGHLRLALVPSLEECEAAVDVVAACLVR